MTDPVRQHDEKLGRVERLTLPEKFAREFRPDKLRAAPGRSVHDEHRVARLALRVFLSFPERPVMNPQLRQAFARGEFEIANCVIAFRWRWIIRRAQRKHRREQCDESKKLTAHRCDIIKHYEVRMSILACYSCAA